MNKQEQALLTILGFHQNTKWRRQWDCGSSTITIVTPSPYVETYLVNGRDFDNFEDAINFTEWAREIRLSVLGFDVFVSRFLEGGEVKYKARMEKEIKTDGEVGRLFEAAIEDKAALALLKDKLEDLL